MTVAPPAFYSLLHCELSHTNAERGPTVEMPKRLSEPCEEPSTSSPRPHYIWAKRRQQRDSPLLQPLICLTPSHPLPGERTPLTSWLFLLAPTLWRSGRGEVIVYRRMQGLTDACVRWRLDTWQPIHLDSDSSRNTKDTCWMEREEQTQLNPFPMFPWWWRTEY